eukprot:CAMPEP_0194170458 /NCGR_PEP_ID=MMETSP0154-20130528/5082_1 /TAXON_ID=1049557 /ORGANISM="Thalassiothrix antarctica, Strain L6-D1" /LENGTH=289 /DNA_ID=CAMNT_0038882291 /DNA_START=28 /DNA_END=894 /DNA_ORIENTATION=-
MKLFAKRGAKATKSKKDKINAADKAVLELLKKDQSKLNSKERRAIKRYEDRGTTTTNDIESTANEDVKKDIVSTDSHNMECEPKNVITKSNNDEADDSDDATYNNEEDDGDDDMTDDDDDDMSDEDEDELKDEDDEKLTDEDDEKSTDEDEDKENDEKSTTDSDNKVEKTIQQEEEEADDSDNKNSLLDSNNNDNDCSGEINEEDLRKLLESVTSKNKRKFIRRLERDGEVAIQSIHEEALDLIKKIQELKDEKAKDEKAKDEKVVSEQKQEEEKKPTPKKRKRAGPDW